jgi:hypothetical protein
MFSHDLMSVFEIQCGVKGEDGSLAPFKIESTISLDVLCRLVAEKLNCFPGVLKQRLCYSLDTDKSKDTRTSLKSDHELEFFIERMRRLLVPQKTANGRISRRILKPVTVLFDDAERVAARKEEGSKGQRTKVCFIICINKLRNLHIQLEWEKSKYGSMELSHGSNTRPAFLAKRDEQVALLQMRWRCEIHSTPGKDVWCYSQGGRPCMTLAMHNLGFWAVEIVSYQSKV